MRLRLVLLGAPGAGKGTQAEKICKKYLIPAISTGNIIREALKSGTKLGIEAKSFIEKGMLVSDEIVIKIVKDRLSLKDCKDGFILDGFPRTVFQAEALDDMGINITKVMDYEVSDEKIISRLSGRRVCETCGANYNLVFNKPKLYNLCDKCLSTLVQRKDDHFNTVNARLKIYHDLTEPLKNYYKKQNKLVIINGEASIDDVTKATFKALEE